MSAILLPAIRRPSVNLVRYDAAGRIQSGTSQFVNWTPSNSDMVKIADMGLAVGDVVSASAELKNDVPGESCSMSISGRDSDGNHISEQASSPVDSQAYTRHVAENYTIPAGTVYLLLYSTRQTGTGAHYIRKGMINRGPTAQAHEWPKRGAWAPMTHSMFARANEQEVQRFLSGAQQITSYPGRQWLLQFATHVLSGDELREWALVLDQLSDLSNTFRFTPPRYQGPSTGYEGPNPAVNGASQLGTSLVCDGVDASTDILDKGDYLSFEVTSAGGETNVELHKITALATSDASGNVTFSLSRPIRLAPADNATVQIYAPTAQFRFAAPRAGIDLQRLRRAQIQVQAEEAIWL